MASLDALEVSFIAAAFLFEGTLILHFALRRWRFAATMRSGKLIYALAVPAALVSVALLAGGKPWSFWLAGLLHLAWAGFGWRVEYVRKDTGWRSPFRPSIGAPYILLYLAATMFYWFPLALLWKPLWYLFAVLFLASTWLNVTSHRPTDLSGQS